MELSRSRRVDGMSGAMSGIPPSEVAAWLALRRVVDEWRREMFVDAVAAMDGVYLKWASEQRAGAEG